MRVSTAYIFDQNLSAMLNQQSELGKTQLQVSTGKRILNPSDDPAGSVQILNLQRELGLSEQYLVNADKAENKQVIEEGALQSSTDMLQRIRELAVQALNATNTQSDRQAISSEIGQLNEQLLAMANTRDSNGDYLFSGFSSNSQPYETIHGAYQGDEGQRNLKVGTGVLIESNDPGNQVFEAPVISTTTTTTLAPVVSSALDLASTATLAVSNYTGGTDTFADITVTFDGTNYLVEGAGVTPAEILAYTPPIPPATVSVDLTTLNSGFPPITIELTGTPVYSAGPPIIEDTFTIEDGTGTGQVNITEDSGVAETFAPITFSFRAEIVADPVGPPVVIGVPAQYDISDGVNTSTVDYVAGMNIDLGTLNPNFPSISVSLSGAPLDGDTMIVEKSVTSVSQSMFKTIDNFVQALNSNTVGANDSPNNGDFLTNITASLNNVVDTRAKVGSRLNAIDQQRQINDGLSLNMQTTLSEIQDLDYAEAISRLTLQTTALQAAQQSFVKVQGLSLFNYL